MHLGAAALAAVVRSGRLSQLQWLWLHENRIGDSGAIALAAALPGRQLRLKQLLLDHNQIGDAGAHAFAVAIADGSLPVCRSLHLGFNPVSSELKTKVTAAFQLRSVSTR